MKRKSLKNDFIKFYIFPSIHLSLYLCGNLHSIYLQTNRLLSKEKNNLQLQNGFINFMLRHYHFSKFILLISICSFTSALVLPPPMVYSTDINALASKVRIGKLAEKAKRYLEKMDGKRLLKTMYELKSEVEFYTGKKINIDAQIDAVFREMKNQGYKASREQEKEIHRMFKQKKVKLERSYTRGEKDEEVEIQVPFKLVIGVTGALCGLFLAFVPLPGTAYLSTFLITTGVKYCCDAVIEAVEQQDNKLKPSHKGD